jgi:hypothetical protein
LSKFHLLHILMKLKTQENLWFWLTALQQI